MKYFFNIFLYLNICIGFLCNLNAQKLQLSIVGEKAVSESLLDSINLPSSFNNYMSLKQELDSPGVRLARFGFIENSFKKLQKKNDSRKNKCVPFKTFIPVSKCQYSNTYTHG